jgi:hypothetical protein
MENAFVLILLFVNMNTHKRAKENIKKRIEQGIFKKCSKPIATVSERILGETGKILEAGRQLMNPELLDSVFFCGCLFLQLDWIFFI